LDHELDDGFAALHGHEKRYDGVEAPLSRLAPPCRVLVALAAGAEEHGAVLAAAGLVVACCETADGALALLEQGRFDVLVVDAALGGFAGGVGLARRLLAEAQRPEVVVFAEKPDVRHAVELGRAGAFEYLPLPVEPERLVATARAAAAAARARGAAAEDAAMFRELATAFHVSTSPAVQEMAAMCRMVASTPEASALVLGEPGSGKTIAARLVHGLSPAAMSPFVVADLPTCCPRSSTPRCSGSMRPNGARGRIPGRAGCSPRRAGARCCCGR
jgi:DNA-binding NtrC family response regulator